MKNISLLLALLISGLNFAQTEISIDFAINQDGHQLVLDSVLIENQTEDCDTMIYFPETSLVIDMLSDIESSLGQGNQLVVNQNYPNPFSEETFIDIFNPEKNIEIKVLDLSGKLVCEKSFETGIGYHKFVFHPGADSQYLVSFSSGHYNKSIKLIHYGNQKSNCKIDYIGISEQSAINKNKSDAFVFTEGDNLSFTAYVTACSVVLSDLVNAAPNETDVFTFDFTGITEIQPDAPVSLDCNLTETSINWDWSEVAGADGYKYNTINNYETATDIATTSSVEIAELTAGTNYRLFVWAYNSCGNSTPLLMLNATTTLPFSVDENNLILSESAGTAMDVMIIFEQPDSIILRTESININFEEENLTHLTDRMKMTVLVESGVGIAAPQIGLNRRVTWIQRYDKGAIVHPWECYFNPVIVRYSDTVVSRSDGCLSVPSGGGYPSVEGFSYRAIWVDVQYINEEGVLVQERIDHQFTAHIFQHEIDHLNAVMFFDRQVNKTKNKFVIIEGDSYDGLPVID